ncbi:MAG: alkyl sulfatase dimerization domain-containing protein [Bilophila wadsworthia]
MLTGFRDAIRYVLEKTLAGMNEGKDIDTLASEIVLPQEYASLPYLGEYYGCVEWTVRAIFTAYLGWFDGNQLICTCCRRRSVRKGRWRAGGTPAAGGGRGWQRGMPVVLELCDLLLTIGVNAEVARRQKAVALTKLAAYETSANGRHYYLVCAHELENRH